MPTEKKVDSLGATIGANLKRERVRAGLNAKQFADLAGTSRSYIVQTENGWVGAPAVGIVYAWASALGVRMEDLMEAPRIEHTSKGRHHARQEARRLAGDGRSSLAEAEAEHARRNKAMRSGAFEHPSDEDAAQLLAGTGLNMGELIAAGERYVSTYKDAADPEAVAAGGYICGVVVGRL